MNISLSSLARSQNFGLLLTFSALSNLCQIKIDQSHFYRSLKGIHFYDQSRKASISKTSFNSILDSAVTFSRTEYQGYRYHDHLEVISEFDSFKDCRFIGCHTKWDGGAIKTEAQVTLQNCYIINCTAGRNGGAIMSKTDFYMMYSTIENSRADDGGSLFLSKFTVFTMANSYILNANSNKNALWHSKGESTSVTLSNFSNFESKYSGGIGVTDGNRIVYYSAVNIFNGTAESNAGFIVGEETKTLNLEKINFVHMHHYKSNSISGDAIFVDSSRGNIMLEILSFVDCASMEQGYAVYIEKAHKVQFLKCCFSLPRNASVYGKESIIFNTEVVFMSQHCKSQGIKAKIGCKKKMKRPPTITSATKGKSESLFMVSVVLIFFFFVLIISLPLISSRRSKRQYKKNK